MLKNKLSQTEKVKIEKIIGTIEPKYRAAFLSSLAEQLAEKDFAAYKNIFDIKRERLETIKSLHNFEALTDISFSERDKADAISLFETNRKKRLKKLFNLSLKEAHIVSEKSPLKESLSQSEEKVR